MTDVEIFWPPEDDPLHDLCGQVGSMYLDVMARQTYDSATQTLGPILGWTGYFDGKKVVSGYGPNDREACKRALTQFVLTQFNLEKS